MKIAIFPQFDGVDKGDGGIRRVVEAQNKYLPGLGFAIVRDVNEADLVVTHGGYPLERKLNKPWVYHTHGAYWNDYDWPRWCHQANNTVVDSAIRADITTVPSEWVGRIFRRGLWIETPVLYSGIEPTEWTPGNKVFPYVLWNKTRVDPVCEIDSLHELVKRAEDVQFISTFGNPTKNLQVTGKLSYQNAKEHVQNASVYLATTRETFGIGTLEAMACEVPILGWAWGGQREIVKHKENGYLCVPGDFDDLTRGLYYCLENREKLGKAAREQAVNNFSWSKVIKDYAKVYRSAHAMNSGKTTKISVIITCYKLAHLLERAVASVRRSSMSEPDYEIIVVDDCSPDNTEEVAKNLRVKYVKTPRNLYVTGALNYGISQANGKYIISLDADNEIGDNTLEVLSEALDRDDELDIVYGKMEVVNSEGQRAISSWPPDIFNYRLQISGQNQIHSSAMYRRVAWERSGGYRERCRTSEDADFWSRLTSLGFKAAKVTDAVTLIYHLRDDSISHTTPEWNWQDWTPWYKQKYENLTPFGVTLDNIPSYEPIKVSVIIPVGPGHETLVKDAIDSLVAQTYTRWEAIVVNDSGSKLPWIHPFVHIIDTGGRKGPATSRNIGVKHASAPLWIPLDADDFLQPEALSLLVKNYEPGFYIYSDWVKSETREVVQVQDYNCENIKRQLQHPVTALYERKMWEAVGGFDETIDSWEDWDFIIALADKGYCGKRVPQPLLHYRIHAGARREDLYARQEAAKEVIARKWHKYIHGGEPMPCGGCGGSKPRNPIPAYNASAPVGSAPSEDMVLVEFIGEGAARTWRGPVTRTEYRFGADAGHNIKYVFTADLEMFTSRDDLFLVRREGAPDSVGALLQAAGPPVAATV